MKLKQTVILFILLVIVATSVYYSEFYSKKNESEKLPASRIFKIKKEDIQKLKIVFSGDSSEFVKENGKWTMIFPFRARGSDYSLDLIARDIEELLYDRIISNSDSSLESFGLHRPTIRIQFSTLDHQIHTITVGNLNMKETFYFIRVDDKPPVYTISSIIKTSWARTGNQLRSKKIFSIQKEDVNDFSFRRGSESYRVEKSNGKWELVAPMQISLIQSSVDSWLDKIFSTEVKDFIAENLASASQYSLVKPKIELSLNGKENSGAFSEQIGLGARKANVVYVSNTRENKIYSLDSSFAAQFNIPVTNWIDKKVISVSTDSVDRIVIFRPNESLSIKRFSNATWLIEPQLVDTLSQESIQTYLAQIGKLNFNEVVLRLDRKEVESINQSKNRILLWKQDKTIADIIIGAKDKDRYLVKGDRIGKVQQGLIDDLLLSRSRLILK